MSRLTFKPGSEVYEDPSIPNNQVCVYVDGCPILKETVHQPENITNYFSAYNMVGMAAFFIDQDKVRLEVIDSLSPFGALKFINLQDPSAFMICELIQIRRNNVFYQIYHITENHSTIYCSKSPRQLALELEERQIQAREVIELVQSN